MFSSSSRTARSSTVAFTTLYLAAMFLPTLPDGAYSDAEVLGLLTDTGSRSLVILAGLLLPLAGLALLPFLSELTGSLRRLDAESPIPGVVFGAGLLYIAMVAVAGTLFGGYATGIAVGELPIPTDATLVRVLNDHGFGTLLIPGLLSAGVMILAASLMARHHALLPKWVCGTGLVVAPLLLLGAMWIPQFLVPLWTLLAAFTLRSPAAVPGPKTAIGV